MKLLKHIIGVIVLVCSCLVSAQQESARLRSEFTLEGSVKARNSLEPIPDATVQILGYRTTTTNMFGEFTIRAQVGDELVVSHPNFETVFYILQSNERVDIRVKDWETDDLSRSKKPLAKRSASSIERHKQNIDSANYYKKRNIEKSILFVENSIKALGKRMNKRKAAESYATLGDIYAHWSQHDLAISNYRIALRYRSDTSIVSKLGAAELANRDIEDAKRTFEQLLKERKASAFYRITAYEGLGDAYSISGDQEQAITNYEEGLQLANESFISPKVTDLNAKLAAAYEKKGEVQQAEDLYSNSLKLAESESPQRSLQRKEQVADFYNRSNLYDQEIELRKQALEEVVELDGDEVVQTTDENAVYDSITPQKINYKIGASYLQQQRLDEAIPYLENSIAQADEAADLIVQKDATRRLSEVYESQGDFTKALEAYQKYVTLVDQLYIQKEQQISQVSRFSKDIADKQNRISSLEKDRQLSESKFNLYAAEQELTSESNKRQKLIIYGLLLGMLLLGGVLFFMYRSVKQQRLNNNLLALRSLRSQMNPHFIFNALNSVNSYIAVNDERNANRYLSEFSTLMRSVLENSEEDFIPLAKEIELLKLYTKLEHARFQEKFDYQITIDERTKVEDFVIPPMLLQPYVENAVWHGLRYKEDKGMLRIDFKQESEQELQITIEDNGIGRERSKALKTDNQRKQRSTGMSNIKRRVKILNEMYKDKVDVHVEDVSETGEGTRVQLLLKKD